MSIRLQGVGKGIFLYPWCGKWWTWDGEARCNCSQSPKKTLFASHASSSSPALAWCPFTSLLPYGFFPMEFWRHWFKRITLWRTGIYLIFKCLMIRFLFSWPKWGLEEKQRWIPTSMIIYWTRDKSKLGHLPLLQRGSHTNAVWQWNFSLLNKIMTETR
jgi:hypothetical protein